LLALVTSVVFYYSCCYFVRCISINVVVVIFTFTFFGASNFRGRVRVYVCLLGISCLQALSHTAISHPVPCIPAKRNYIHRFLRLFLHLVFVYILRCVRNYILRDYNCFTTGLGKGPAVFPHVNFGCCQNGNCFVSLVGPSLPVHISKCRGRKIRSLLR
jgi:hypothetical protein